MSKNEPQMFVTEHWSSRILSYGIFMLILYAMYGVVYRLYLSPLANFPGPKIAALTDWYEFYYDVIKRGKYTWRIAEMHERYGPIIRISPDQLHINDPDFLDEIYPGSAKKTDKPPRYAGMFGRGEATFSTPSHELHRTRRAWISPFFSKRSITRLEPVLQSAVDKLCGRLGGFWESGEPVNLRSAYMALTMDVINQYCFARSDNNLDAPDFNPSWYQAMMELSELSHSIQQFPWLFPIVVAIPKHWLLKITNPVTYQFILMQRTLETKVRSLMGEKDASHDPAEHSTIFHVLLDKDIPPPERTSHRLGQEAISLVTAGSITTAHVLKTTTYHLLANPLILHKLTTELKQAMPNPTVPTPLVHLENLPYLTAVISEGLRISYGVSHRLQRSAPDRAIQFQDYTIPPGTPVSMTSVLIHDNPHIFPDPHTFTPERWLDAKPGAGDQQRLDKYLVTFSKGTRGCLGLNLAYAELYLTLANVFRKFEMRLFDTVRERDVDVSHDFFNPSPKLSSKGMRVTVVGRPP